MSQKPFQFKEFTVNQDQCAMKIGTDAVLLGAWATIKKEPVSVLDIGAGTGILALMLAQRCYAELIDAIEIDDKAYEQCVDNFEQSPWGDRLFCYHASLQDFVSEIEDLYDLIICNPPFYAPALVSAASKKEAAVIMSDARKTARFHDAMPFEYLLESVSKLLSEQGVFSVVIPFTEKDSFVTLASTFKLHANRLLLIKGTPASEIKRALIEFSFRESDLTEETLVIETARHQYTEAYVNLTKDFYLKM